MTRDCRDFLGEVVVEGIVDFRRLDAGRSIAAEGGDARGWSDETGTDET